MAPLSSAIISQLQAASATGNVADAGPLLVGGTLYAPLVVQHVDEGGWYNDLLGFGAFNPGHMQPGDTYTLYGKNGAWGGTRKIENGGAMDGLSLAVLAIITMGAAWELGVLGGFGGSAPELTGGGGLDASWAGGFTDTGTAGGALDTAYAGSGAVTGAGGEIAANVGGEIGPTTSGITMPSGSTLLNGAKTIAGLAGAGGGSSRSSGAGTVRTTAPSDTGTRAPGTVTSSAPGGSGALVLVAIGALALVVAFAM